MLIIKSQRVFYYYLYCFDSNYSFCLWFSEDSPTAAFANNITNTAEHCFNATFLTVVDLFFIVIYRVTVHCSFLDFLIYFFSLFNCEVYNVTSHVIYRTQFVKVTKLLSLRKGNQRFPFRFVQL
jgi:hypothetical protein